MVLHITTAHAVDDGYPVRNAPIPQLHLTAGRTTGVYQSLYLHTGDDIFHNAIAVARFDDWIEVLESGCQDYRACFQLNDLVLLFEVDRTGRAKFLACPAFPS